MQNTIHKSDKEKETWKEVHMKYEREQIVNERSTSGSQF